MGKFPSMDMRKGMGIITMTNDPRIEILAATNLLAKKIESLPKDDIDEARFLLLKILENTNKMEVRHE